jgi:hypothetical protein
MIRLLLIILLLFVGNGSWNANRHLVSIGEVTRCSLKGSSSEYSLCNQHEFGDAFIGYSSNGSFLFPWIKKNHDSDYLIIDEIKSNGFYFTDADLLFLIRKDNLFLSILRI